MERKLLETILENTFTKSDLERRLRLLKEYLVKSLFREVKAGKVTPELLNIKSDRASDLEWLENLSFGHFNRQNLHEKLNEIAKMAQDLPTIVINLSVEPTEREISDIGSKVRATFKDNFLINIKIDPSLIAGCSLVWEGVIKDYSLRAKIEEQKQAILQSFKRALK